MAQAMVSTCCTVPATRIKVSVTVLSICCMKKRMVGNTCAWTAWQLTDGSEESMSKGTSFPHFGSCKLEEDRFNINPQYSKPQKWRTVAFFCCVCK